MNSEALKDITGQALETLTRAIQTGDFGPLTRALRSMATLRTYSVSNMLLIENQRKGTTRAAPKSVWNELGRTVRSDAPAIAIWVPGPGLKTVTPEQTEAQEDRAPESTDQKTAARCRARFLIGQVYAFEDTEGEPQAQVPLLSGNDLQLFLDVARVSPYTLKLEPVSGGTHCTASTFTADLPGLGSIDLALRTLLLHWAAENDLSAPHRVAEASMVAYVVLQAMGIDSELPPEAGLMYARKPKSVKNTLKRVKERSMKLIETLPAPLLERAV